ncbi:pre-60S factor rei1 [Microbotryomycetes sp. JL221]|nr:pre-60S factor rei1 [Microbotryomycetes sp. JL221]
MESHPYTCMSCQLAFADAVSQRTHFASDHHTYNLRRRAAQLPPITLDLFNQKVAERQQLQQQQQQLDQDGQPRLSCKACNKTFNSEQTMATHEKSKKHRDNVFKAASAVKVADLKSKPEAVESTPAQQQDLTPDEPVASTSSSSSSSNTSVLAPAAAAITTEQQETVDFESSGDPKLDLLVARRIRTAPPIPTTSCLFCSHSSSTTQDNVAHMRQAHSFLIPDLEYLVDLQGLLKRLGEEVGTWNVCVYCGKGYGGNINLDAQGTDEELCKKASKGVEAVRAHMQDKSHCKLPYDTEEQKLDVADFYDFRPSYPDYQLKQARKEAKKLAKQAAKANSEWEDVDGEGDATMEGDDDLDAEIVYELSSEDDSDSEGEDDDDEQDLPDSSITYGDSAYELVLPSGLRIGHRAHKHIYKQNLAPYLGQNPFKPSAHSSPSSTYKPSPHSQALLSLVPAMQQRNKDRTHSKPIYDAGLIPAKGAGFGGNGDVIRARNKGEAKHAAKATREFTGHKARQQQDLIRGLRGNSQKHYRDPLLQ